MDIRIKHIPPTICIVHKGFRGFRAFSPASILGGNLIGLKPAIPYDTIHSPLCFSVKKRREHKTNDYKYKLNDRTRKV
jgi:hypothetical protein